MDGDTDVSTTLRTRISIVVQAFKSLTVGSTYPLAQNPLVSGSAGVADPVVYDWANGTASGQASKEWSVEVTITPGTNVTYNLAALTDEYGTATTFTKVKAMSVRNVSGAGVLQLNPGLFNPINLTDPGYASGDAFVMVRPAGIPVDEAHLNTTMTIAAVGGTVIARIIIIGD